MPSALIIIMYALAVARITRLITHDVITEPIRSALLRRFDPQKRRHRLAVYALGDMNDNTDGCPWCVSVWVSVASAPAAIYWQHNTITATILLALAASYATGIMAEHTGRRP